MRDHGPDGREHGNDSENRKKASQDNGYSLRNAGLALL